jgi:hypothetical protein
MRLGLNLNAFLPGALGASTILPLFALTAVLGIARVARAQDAAITAARTLPLPAPVPDRYGLFNLLDHRSRYATNWYPEPLLSDEMDWDQEIRLDWFHAEKRGIQRDEVHGEVEFSLGLLTLEVGVPYERNSEQTVDPITGEVGHDRSEGIGSIELAARHPVYQYVSSDGFFDFTLGARLEVAVPSGSDVGKNTEIVPGLYAVTGFGEHLSLQTSVAYSALFGPGDDGGLRTLEYAAVLGWRINHKELPLPGVQCVFPIFELDGELPLNHEDSGIDSLTGVAGFRINFDSIGVGQPKIGIGYAFPIDKGARQDFNWGIVTSLVLEF